MLARRRSQNICIGSRIDEQQLPREIYGIESPRWAVTRERAMNTTVEDLEERLQQLEKKVRRARLTLVVGAGALILASCMAIARPDAAAAGSAQPDNASIIRARGIIIEDAAGRPRILLGAPAPTVSGRDRQDALTGLVYIDESGADRVTLGAAPDPMTARGVVRRRTGSAGILIHDREGIERGGYGVLDDGMALLTLDWPKSGEGVALMSNNQFSGMSLYNYTDPPTYPQAAMLGVTREGGGGFLTLNNADGAQRITIMAEGQKAPELITWNRERQQVSRRNLE
jgi:hypothetical protein